MIPDSFGVHTLFIDLASHAGAVAIVDAASVLSLQSVDHRITDGELTALIERLLNVSSLHHADLERIACVVGPGGFTSLRVAVSCANALGHFLHLPLAGIHLSDLCAARCVLKDVLWLHSTKRDLLFVRGFGTLAKEFPEPTVHTLEEVSKRITSPTPFVGELLPEHAKVLGDLGASPAKTAPLEEVLPSFLAAQRFSADLLEPWYGRGW